MKNTQSTRLKSAAIFTLCLLTLFAPFTPLALQSVEAIDRDNIQINAIDRTRIRLVDVELNEADYNNTNAQLKDSYGSREALNEALQNFFAGKDFDDEEIWDNNEDYRLTVESDNLSCTSVMDSFESGEDNLKVRLSVPMRVVAGQGGRECKNITTDNVPLGNHLEILKAFAWVDETRIRRYQSEDVFVKAEQGVGRYLLEGDSDGNCVPYIETIDFENADYHRLRGTATCQHLQWDDGFVGSGPIAVRIGQLDKRDIPPGQGEIPGGDGGDAEEAPPSCESENPDGLDWLLCGVVNFIDKMLIGKDGTGGLLGEVDDLLNISDQYYSDDRLEQAWSYFRNIASLALVLVGLIMVIGQALSKE